MSSNLNFQHFLWHNRICGVKPFSFVHFVTFRCNCHCPHCFVDEENDPLTLNNLELEKFISNISPGVYNVNLTGGEPFCLENFIDIVLLYWNNSPISSIYICTNGSFPEKINELVQKLPEKNNKQLTISISLDHFPRQHDKMRGLPGLFEGALSVFQKLQKLKHPQLRANAALTVQEGNYKEILAIIDFFRTLNLPALSLTLQRSSGKLTDPGAKINQLILQAYQQAITASKKEWTAGKSLFEKIITAKNHLMQEHISKGRDMPYVPCCAGQDFAVMYPDGSVFPCEMLNQPIANIRDFNLNLSQLLKEKGGKLNRQIRKNRCSCSYECAKAVSMLLNPTYLSRILLNL